MDNKLKIKILSSDSYVGLESYFDQFVRNKKDNFVIKHIFHSESETNIVLTILYKE